MMAFQAFERALTTAHKYWQLRHFAFKFEVLICLFSVSTKHAMSIQKHNKSVVVLPPDVTRQQAKRAVMTSTLKERERVLLFWVLDHEANYVITVAQIRAELLWGEKKWITVRDQLKKKLILKQFKVGLENKTSQWTLTFDLNPIFSEPQKAGSRTHDPFKARVSPTTPQIRRDMNLKPTPPRPPGGIGIGL